jgi:ketosteroid isomerase-like protein
MSQENVEIVRRSIEAWNRRDVPTLSGFYRADAEIDWSRSRGPFKGVYRGQLEHEAFWDVFFSTFEEGRLETHEFMQAGPEVVVTNTAHFRGREGIELTARSTLVFTVEDGQITCLRLFQRE